MSSLSKNVHSTSNEDTRCFLRDCDTKKRIWIVSRRSVLFLTAQHAAISNQRPRRLRPAIADPFKDLQESLDALKAADTDLVPEFLSVQNVIDVDNDVIATALCIMEDGILEKSVLDILKNASLYSTTGDKNSEFSLKIRKFISKRKIVWFKRSKQTNKRIFQ